MKFKVGDKVRVREDLKVGKRYDDWSFVEQMKEYKGRIVTIAKINDFNYTYDIVEDNGDCAWNDEMLEPIKEQTKKLTLEEAIEHYQDVADSEEVSCEECKEKHEQLKDWLVELKNRRDKEQKIMADDNLRQNKVEIISSNGEKVILNKTDSKRLNNYERAFPEMVAISEDIELIDVYTVDIYKLTNGEDYECIESVVFYEEPTDEQIKLLLAKHKLMHYTGYAEIKKCKAFDWKRRN